MPHVADGINRSHKTHNGNDKDNKSAECIRKESICPRYYGAILIHIFHQDQSRIRVAIEPIRLTVSTCFFDLVKKHNIPVNIGARRRYSIMLSTYQIFEQIRIYTFKCFVYPENQDTHDKNPYQDIKKNPDLNK